MYDSSTYIRPVVRRDLSKANRRQLPKTMFTFRGRLTQRQKTWHRLLHRILLGVDHLSKVSHMHPRVLTASRSHEHGIIERTNGKEGGKKLS